MAREHEIDSVNAPVPQSSVTRQQFIDILEHLNVRDAANWFEGANKDREKLKNDEEITGDATLSLDAWASILNQTAGGPYSITIPDGNYVGEEKMIMVKPSGTSTFTLTGTLREWDKVEFRDVARSAWLVWDGGGWHFVSGNADPQSSNTQGQSD